MDGVGWLRSDSDARRGMYVMPFSMEQGVLFSTDAGIYLVSNKFSPQNYQI